ncbi:MotE family protein [uncultured Sphingomonas sp.]|uniref:MotE family protein n=1 Tax=uncultured Sphingomonas sp. TaxID=158754 RepID=UPI0035CC333B
MIGRPSLLLLTAAATAVAGIANAVGVASPDPVVPQTRLGVAIADDVDARDKSAVRRGRSLDLREQAIRAAEARLKADLETRAAPVGAGAPGIVAAGEPAVPDQFDDLAKIYQAMKPAAAALVLEQLDLDVQMRVAQRMRERSTAMILAAMTPKAAAALTMALARRQAPRPSYVTPVAVKPQVAKR